MSWQMNLTTFVIAFVYFIITLIEFQQQVLTPDGVVITIDFAKKT